MVRRVLCNGCGAMWDFSYVKICPTCTRELNPMRNTTITVSDEANLDMFRKVDPSPEAQHFFESPLGIAECEDCGSSWSCHLRAWGSIDRVSRCNKCGGDVVFNLISGGKQ